tara:strand:- start:107 stop:646 length:540 start_codon:yes stop_codon:yes gene_type:complete
MDVVNNMKKKLRYLYNDFLPAQSFNEWKDPIQESILWQYGNDYSFTRVFWAPLEGPVPTQEGERIYPLIHQLLSYIQPEAILRIKLNLDLARSEHFETGYHTDMGEGFEYKTAIFYFNDCNGFTQFEKDKAPVKSKANRLIIFDGRLKHQGVIQTDTAMRYVLNLCYVSSKVPEGGLTF